jgi:hypothetical protein
MSNPDSTADFLHNSELYPSRSIGKSMLWHDTPDWHCVNQAQEDQLLTPSAFDSDQHLPVLPAVPVSSSPLTQFFSRAVIAAGSNADHDMALPIFRLDSDTAAASSSSAAAAAAATDVGMPFDLLPAGQQRFRHYDVLEVLRRNSSIDADMKMTTEQLQHTNHAAIFSNRAHDEPSPLLHPTQCYNPNFHINVQFPPQQDQEQAQAQAQAQVHSQDFDDTDTQYEGETGLIQEPMQLYSKLSQSRPVKRAKVVTQDNVTQARASTDYHVPFVSRADLPSKIREESDPNVRRSGRSRKAPSRSDYVTSDTELNQRLADSSSTSSSHSDHPHKEVPHVPTTSVSFSVSEHADTTDTNGSSGSSSGGGGSTQPRSNTGIIEGFIQQHPNASLADIREKCKDVFLKSRRGSENKKVGRARIEDFESACHRIFWFMAKCHKLSQHETEQAWSEAKLDIPAPPKRECENTTQISLRSVDYDNIPHGADPKQYRRFGRSAVKTLLKGPVWQYYMWGTKRFPDWITLSPPVVRKPKPRCKRKRKRQT